MTTKSTNSWGGKRTGAGRPRTNAPRCACGKHTLARAIRLRYKCRKLVAQDGGGDTGLPREE